MDMKCQEIIHTDQKNFGSWPESWMFVCRYCIDKFIKLFRQGPLSLKWQ